MERGVVKEMMPPNASFIMEAGGGGGGGGGAISMPAFTLMQGPVMTDEQLETLRRQISVYATICQQLVEMHKAIMAQQTAISGLRLGQAMPYEPSMISAGHKLTSRQRWTPSQIQLQILEKLFQQGNGTPNKQKIKEITAELVQHGPISETNVYNWFQNRRARTKRKQQLGVPNTGESEVDTDADSPHEKKVKVERDPLIENSGIGKPDVNFQGCEEAVLVQPNDIHQFTQKILNHGNILAPAGSYEAGRNNGAEEPINLALVEDKYSIAG